MTWVRRTFNAYKKVVAKRYKNRKEDIVVQGLIIRGESLKRDFTKRQLKLLLLINMLSHVFGKESAVIPQLSDFQISGVSKTKVKEELEKLVTMNVIEINDTRYSIKDPAEWDVPYHKSYYDPRAREVFMLNLLDTGVSLEEIKREIASMEEKN
ncbi:replication protein [Neobacillus pocheonensis]|uniref:Replication protein n=1 Tax=Neobacillus pocheonensis TaxID=363869 RepID=A0ABT0WJI1_9BACI|nr:replication protein [Neobacillus pocheonensis]